jgi:hypothetical protein
MLRIRTIGVLLVDSPDASASVLDKRGSCVHARCADKQSVLVGFGRLMTDLPAADPSSKTRGNLQY